MTSGRPPKFKDPEEMQTLIDAYFLSCWAPKRDMFGNTIYEKDEKKKLKLDDEGKPIPVLYQFKPYTITGMAVFLGTTRDILIAYEKKKKFSNTIKVAKAKCHAYAEESLFIGKNPSGAIFNLKNNYGWKDESKVLNVNENITINDEQYNRIIKREASNIKESGA